MSDAATEAVRLDGRAVVVTGAGRGSGRAAALAMARAGAGVVVNDVDSEAARGVVDEITAAGGEAVAEIAAIGPTSSAEACVERALSAFGRLDAMCTNAGLLRDRVLWKTTDEEFDAVVETHLRGTFTCARAAARAFRETGQGGRLILVASIAGQRGSFGQTVYSAAKAGVAAMARTWSMELARDGVTVNAVVPNALTRMVASIPGFAEHVEAAERGEPVPARLRRDLGLGTAEDVAPLFVWLASAASAGVTGQCIGIGGDRLSLWGHPKEVAVDLCEGGWSAEEIARRWPEGVGATPEDVGVDMTP